MRNFILGLERLCLCCVSLLRLLSSLFFILLHKRMDQRPPRDGSANYSACRPRSSASHSSCCSVWSFSDKLGRRKKWQTRGSQHGLSSLFIPYYFLVSFDKLSFAQEKTLQTLCKNHFISQKICQQQILPNCRQLRATTTSSPFVLHSDIHDNVLVDSFESRYARNPCLFPSPNGSHSSAESNQEDLLIPTQIRKRLESCKCRQRVSDLEQGLLNEILLSRCLSNHDLPIYRPDHATRTIGFPQVRGAWQSHTQDTLGA